MPGFASELSDRQVTTLSHYVLRQWGNPEVRVTVDQVGQLRSGTPGTSYLLVLARAGMAVAALLLVGLLVMIVRRRRGRVIQQQTGRRP
jgi:hypothetical protein